MPLSIESHIGGQSDHSNHPLQRSTTQTKYCLNHIYLEGAVLTQKLILWGILWNWAEPTRCRIARVWAPRLRRYLVLNAIIKHHTNPSFMIAGQFSILCWHLAHTAWLITMLRLSILRTRAFAVLIWPPPCVFNWRCDVGPLCRTPRLVWEQSEVGNTKMAISWESWIRVPVHTSSTYSC